MMRQKDHFFQKYRTRAFSLCPRVRRWLAYTTYFVVIMAAVTVFVLPFDYLRGDADAWQIGGTAVYIALFAVLYLLHRAFPDDGDPYW